MLDDCQEGNRSSCTESLLAILQIISICRDQEGHHLDTMFHASIQQVVLNIAKSQ
jgi:hypothetical protein